MSTSLKNKIADHTGKELEGEKWKDCFDDGRKWLERIQKAPQKTIIIPVYNGYDALTRCLNSLEHAQGIDNVVLVNDNSYDERVNSCCNEWADKCENRSCITNIRNIGFVRSVNVGLNVTPADHDVVVLNSDTILSRFCIERLQKASCSFPNVATVTPVSNSAGIFSIPKPKIFNPLRSGYTVDDYAQLLEYVVCEPYEIVPAGSGFCLYIPRKALNSVGVFDEMLFERGYAEETDFCRRAARKGFINLVDMSAFVFHESEVSFGMEKNKLKKRNASILKIMDERFIPDSLKWENETRLKLLWKVFPEVLQSLKKGSDEPFLNQPTNGTVLKICQPNTKYSGFINNNERCIQCNLTNSAVTLDFFGIKKRKVNIKHEELIDLIAYLKARFGVGTIKEEQNSKLPKIAHW